MQLAREIRVFAVLLQVRHGDVDDIQLAVLEHRVPGAGVQHDRPLDPRQLRRALEIVRVALQDDALAAAVFREPERARADQVRLIDAPALRLDRFPADARRRSDK